MAAANTVFEVQAVDADTTDGRITTTFVAVTAPEAAVFVPTAKLREHVAWKVTIGTAGEADHVYVDFYDSHHNGRPVNLHVHGNVIAFDTST